MSINYIGINAMSIEINNLIEDLLKNDIVPICDQGVNQGAENYG